MRGDHSFALFIIDGDFMKVLNNVSYNDDYEACKLDVYLPDEQTRETVVYFHGGGIQSGDKAEKNYVEIAESFVKAGYAFVSVNYRMYPTAKFPDYLQDAAKAVAYAKSNFAGQREIIIGGQSAGAWISLMLCLNGEYLQREGVSPMEIKAWLIDSAQTTAHFNVLAKESGLHSLTQRINEYAPLFYVDEKTAFSKMLLLFYENDMPCRPEQNMLFYKNVLAFNPKADISYQQLRGGHCHGSIYKDEDGEYSFVKTALTWLNRE